MFLSSEPSLKMTTAPFYAEVAKETKKVVFIKDDLTKILNTRSLKSDTVHPNADGYVVLAQAVFKALADNGALDKVSP